MTTNATLEFLLRRMRHTTDFPALSGSVSRIQRVVNSEHESLGSLSDVILQDVALTHKLLRLVNTAHYSTAAGTVSTVSRAVSLIGFVEIRDMALSLVLLDHMEDKAHAHQLREEFLRALMAGTLASELGALVVDGEEAFLGALFQNLGRLLTGFYFAEEARQVRDLLAAPALDGHAAITEEAAAARVLGLSFEELGLGVARVWGLPPTLQRCMSRPVGEPPARRVDNPVERLRWLTLAANQITGALLSPDAAEGAAEVTRLAHRHAGALGLDAERIVVATEQARLRLQQIAEAMGLQAAPGSASVSGRKAALSDASTDDATNVLAAGIQDIAQTLAGPFKLNDVLRMILETMFRALGFRRVVFCLRDAKTDMLTGRFGLGEGAEGVAANFKVPLKASGDLFAAVCLKGADSLISDATVPTIASRLPAWYRSAVNAPAFLLLPLQMKGAPFALIYADKATPGGIELGEAELSLLRTLRDQAVAAFKQQA